MKEVILVVLALAAVSYAAWQHIRMRRTLHRLDEMLTQAMDGGFSADRYDESMLSAVEARFARYLSASAISAARVREEKEAVQSLIGDISHQTKTPLANIQLHAQLLSEQPLTEQGRTCVEALDSQTEKLKSLLDALVKTSRLETGVLALRPEPADLVLTVRRAAVQYQRAAAEKGIVLVVDLPDVLPAVFDAKWTEEALCNLLDNAAKYTPCGGRMTVTGTVYELFTRIDVADTGCGIAEEEQAKVFGRFYRCVSAAQTQGVGIGLYLTREILTREGGYIKVASHEGQGSTFSIFLPREVSGQANVTKPLDS